MAYVNHNYFYLWDPEWGPAFWKTNAYSPYPIWLWLNGHEWAKRQMEKVGIAYEALDNGLLSCADPEALQRRCGELGSADVQDFFQRWLSRLPSPFTKLDFDAGYAYDLAFRQFEVSETEHLRLAPGRARVVRGRDSRSPGHRSARPSRLDLSARNQPANTGTLSDPGHHQGSRSDTHLLLQILAPQAVLQGRPMPAWRVGHLRHARLWDRAARLRQELECPTGCWRIRQPATD